MARLTELNRTYRREMGAGIMEPFERHRSRTLLRDCFGEEEVYENVLLKREALKRISGAS